MFAESVGVADLGDSRPIQAQDRFRIGSVTEASVTGVIRRQFQSRVLASRRKIREGGSESQEDRCAATSGSGD